MVEAAKGTNLVIAGKGQHKVEAGNYNKITVKEGASVYTTGEVHVNKLVLEDESTIWSDSTHANKFIAKDESGGHIATARTAKATSGSIIDLDALANKGKIRGKGSDVIVDGVSLSNIGDNKAWKIQEISNKITVGGASAALTGIAVEKIDRQAAGYLFLTGVTGFFTGATGFLLGNMKENQNIHNIKAKELPEKQ